MKQVNNMAAMMVPVATKVNQNSGQEAKGFNRFLKNYLDKRSTPATEVKAKNHGIDKLTNQLTFAKTSTTCTVDIKTRPNLAVSEQGLMKGKVKIDRVDAEKLMKEISQLLEDGKLTEQDLANILEVTGDLSALVEIQELLAKLQALMKHIVFQAEPAVTVTTGSEGSTNPSKRLTVNEPVVVTQLQQLAVLLETLVHVKKQLGTDYQIGPNQNIFELTELTELLDQLKTESQSGRAATEQPQTISHRLAKIVSHLEQNTAQILNQKAIQVLEQLNGLVKQVAPTVGEGSLLIQHLQGLQKVAEESLRVQETINNSLLQGMAKERSSGLVARVATVRQAVLAQGTSGSEHLVLNSLGEAELLVVTDMKNMKESGAGNQKGSDESAQGPDRDLPKDGVTFGKSSEMATNLSKEWNVPFKVVMEQVEPVVLQIANLKELDQITQLKEQQQVLTPKIREHIWTQVVEKAKLVNVGNESEMLIKLKPEHLGKVSLQISMENGIMKARFLAESQIVKEVIEANINNLKQSLTNQGVKVEQIMVQISSDSGQPQWSRQPNQTNFSSRSNRSNRRGDSVEGTETVEESSQTAEYGGHLLDEGSVNYVI